MFNIDIIQDALNKKVKAGKLSSKTARDYVNCLTHLSESLGNRDSPAEIEKTLYELCKDNVQGHKYLAAVKRYEKEVLGAEGLLLFGEPLTRLYQRYGQHKLGKELAYSEETYFRKVNRLNNERLKLAYRLQFRSGLRIGEIAALDKEKDILFDDAGRITLLIRSGKGRRSRKVEVMDDSYLYDRLKAHIESLAAGEAPFYNESYLKKKAYEHGIKTHDLRRINSRVRFRNELQDGSGKRAARRVVGKQLGHEIPATTNIYLGCEWFGKSDFEERTEGHDK